MSLPLSGRKAEALRNDEAIIEAAREVFLADPNAPIAEVAERAGVGIGALYRRYRSKEELIQRLAADGLDRYVANAEAALTGDGDPWAALVTFMRRSLQGGANAMSLRFAGTFTPTEAMNQAGRRGYELTQEILDRAKAAGELRADIGVGDLHFLFEQLQAVDVGDPKRTAELRERYLTLLLDALHTPAPTPLPGAAPAWQDIRGRYER